MREGLMETLLAMQVLGTEFCHANDGRDAKWVGRCFAKDASHLGANGRDEIERLFEKIWAGQRARRRHVLTNFILTEDKGQQATALAYELLYLIKDRNVELLLTGLYEMEGVVEDDAWRIRRLGIYLDVPYEPGDVSSMTSEVDEQGRHRLIPA